MGKKTKKGASRLDKYYKLAKEQGYRSRAAFKLIQLNRRHEFLNGSHTLLDLCAAPGGWSQVAYKTMPLDSTIIAVDLVPFKSVPRVTNIVGDITKGSCAANIKNLLMSKRGNAKSVDCVIHDGSPNVGTSWLHDAFAQASLTLSALKLATVFMKRDAVFVTKLFRSKDHAAVVNVCQKLFKKVIVTKPRASRETSAEIYVICLNYLAPAKIDPALLDPNTVFEEVLDPEVELNTSMVKKIEAIDFLRLKKNIADVAKDFHQVVFTRKESQKIYNDPLLTGEELKLICKDLQVAGKRELRLLARWKEKLQKLFEHSPEDMETNDSGEQDGEEESGEEEGSPDDAENEENDGEDDTTTTLDKELAELRKTKISEAKKKKRKLKREEMKRQSRIRRNRGGPDAPNDDELPGESYFSTKEIAKMKSTLGEQKGQNVTESGEYEIYVAVKDGTDESGDENVARELDADEYIENIAEEYDDIHRHEVMERGKEKGIMYTEAVEEEGEDESLEPVEEIELSDTDSESDESEDEEESEADDVAADKWFAQDIFQKGNKRAHAEEEAGDVESKKRKIDSEEEPEDVAEPEEEEDKATEPQENEFSKLRSDPEKLAQIRIIGKEIYEKGKDRFIEESFNRHAFRTEKGLPSWFIEDERKSTKKPEQISKARVSEEMKSDPILYGSIASTTIKKVAEARARKKKRALRSLNKVKDEMETIIGNPDVNAAEKRKAIEKFQNKLRNKGKDPRNDKKYVVSKKGGGSYTSKGAKGGRVKRVDKRMKKDTRAEKARQRRGGSRGGRMRR